MIIKMAAKKVRLTEDYKKSNGKVIPKGTVLECYGEMPFKHELVSESTEEKPKTKAKAK